MGLQIWLPLIGDMHNQGMSGVTVTSTSATVDANGKIGSCMKIVDAVDLYYAPDFGTGSFSFCGWFKFNKAEITTKVSTLTINATYKQPTGNLIGNNSYGGIGITWNANNVYADGAFNSMSIMGTIRTSTISARNTGSFAVSFDTWIHIALLWDYEAKKLSIYKDGIHYASTTTPDFSDAVIRSLIINYPGVWSGNGPSTTIPFRANDIRVYNHCLSAKEVKEISKGLACHYKLESHNLKNVFSYPTFDTSAAAGGWAHWGQTGAQGTQGQNTDKNYIFNKKNTYSHWVQNASAATGNYLLYQSPSFDTTIASGGYRTMVAIMKRDDGLGINDSVCFPSWNANVAASSVTYNKWTEIRNLGDGFYLGKCEGICQNGSNNLAGIYICPGYKIYFSEVYLENYATAASYINDVTGTTDVMEDCSGYGRDGLFLSGTVFPTKIEDGGRYTAGIENANGYTGMAEVNMPALNTLTFSWWGYYKELGRQNSGLFSTSDSSSAPTDYTTTAFNHRDALFDICNNSNSHVTLSTSSLPLNAWRHFCVTYDGSTAKYYVNGDLKNSVAQTGALKAFKYLYIGYSKAGGATRMCKAIVSDFRIYATCLSNADILELYNVGNSIDNKGNLLTYELKEA